MTTTFPSKGAPWRAPKTLSACRRELAQVEAQLSSVRAELVSLKARVEHAAIEAAGGAKALGSNADDRERALRLALDDDVAYADAALEEQLCSRRVLALRAEIQVYEDVRRGDELTARERLIDLLERIAPSRHLDDSVLERAAGVVVLPDYEFRDGGAD